MKVRHRATYGYQTEGDVTYDVIEESARFYIARSVGNAEPVVLKKKDYEPVPTETWRDVTGGCSADYINDEGWHFSENGKYVWPGGGYRLRKVQFHNRIDAWGFIIERKES